jgi:hypothetical protein
VSTQSTPVSTRSVLLLQRQATRRSSSLYHDERDDVNAKVVLSSFYYYHSCYHQLPITETPFAPVALRVERTGDERSEILSHADHLTGVL